MGKWSAAIHFTGLHLLFAARSEHTFSSTLTLPLPKVPIQERPDFKKGNGDHLAKRTPKQLGGEVHRYLSKSKQAFNGKVNTIKDKWSPFKEGSKAAKDFESSKAIRFLQDENISDNGGRLLNLLHWGDSGWWSIAILAIGLLVVIGLILAILYN